MDGVSFRADGQDVPADPDLFTARSGDENDDLRDGTRRLSRKDKTR